MNLTEDHVVVAKVTNVYEMRDFLKRLKIRGRSFIIKPNWSNANTFTSAGMLDLLFHCLDGDKTIIEGYTAWRNELNAGSEPEDVITPSNAKRKWKWIKEQDLWFLKHTGIENVLRKHGVRYVNVTEEVWSGRIADKGDIKKIVEKHFDPVKNDEMYGFVPEKIYTLKSRALVSANLSRLTREIMSLSTKNLFGLIPDPARYGKWHGENDALLPQSILDINKIYRSLFEPCFWINEVKDRRILIGSQNSVLADAVAARIVGVNPREIPYLELALKVFGGYDEVLVSRALKELESS
jgi:hypothetical protein